MSNESKNEFVYMQFAKAVMERAKELDAGLNVTCEDKKGWLVYTGLNGNRVCVQKAATKLPVVETTFAAEDVGGEATPAPNGRIQSRIPGSDLEKVARALVMLGDPQKPIAPPKRGKGAQRAIPKLEDLLPASE